MFIGKVSRFFSGVSRNPIYKQIGSRLMSSQLAEGYNYETLKVLNPREYVFQVELNRPEKRNAINSTMWKEFVTCFQQISNDKDCRTVVISGSGKIFSAGIDLQCLAEVAMEATDSDIGRKAMTLQKFIIGFQESFTVFEKCPKPVLLPSMEVVLALELTLLQLVICDTALKMLGSKSKKWISG